MSFSRFASLAFCVFLIATSLAVGTHLLLSREVGCEICGRGEDVRWLLDEAEQVLKFQKDHTIGGFPLTGWGVEDNEPINYVSSPRFIQFWNLSTLSGGGEALDYMKKVTDTFFSKSLNRGFPWFYDIREEEIKKDYPLPAYVVGDVLMGLSHIYEKTREERFRQRAEKMGWDSIDLFLDKESDLLFNVIDFNLKPCREVDSEVGNVLLLIDGWLSLYNVFGDESFLHVAERAVEGLWSLRNQETGLVPEVFNVSNGTKGDWMDIGTGGELMETLYYLWYLTADDEYISKMEELADTQIKYFWDSSLDRFVDRVRVSDGVVIDKSCKAIRLESNIYSLFRLYAVTGNHRYLRYGKRTLDTYIEHGFVNGVPIASIDGANNVSATDLNPGLVYPFLKSATMLSVFEGSGYLKKALSAARKSVSLLKKKYGYPWVVDAETGEVLIDNQDIGGVMWFQDEGLAVLASFLVASPQWDLGESGKTSVVTVAENSFLRGIRVSPDRYEYELGLLNVGLGDKFCFISPGGAKLQKVHSRGIFFLRIGGNCVLALTPFRTIDSTDAVVRFTD